MGTWALHYHGAVSLPLRFAPVEYFELQRKSFLERTSFWAKFYYAAGLLGGCMLVYTRVDWDGSKAAKLRVRKRAPNGYFHGPSKFEGATDSSLEHGHLAAAR
jgi:hypothetical protein